MTTATIAPTPTGPLSPSQQAEIAAANERAKKIRKAATVAKFNGWVTGFFAACSIPFGLFSVVGFLVAAGLCFVAYNEFKGRTRLLQFDTKAPTFLGWNQVGFLALIVLYCMWMLVTGLTGAGPFTEELMAKPELRSVLGSVDEFDKIYKIVVVALYGTVIVLSVIFQGMNALYYFARRKDVEAYVQETPTWVLDLQRLTSPE